MWREFGNGVTTCQRAANTLKEFPAVASLHRLETTNVMKARRLKHQPAAGCFIFLLSLLVAPAFAASYAPKRAPGAEIFDNKTVLPIRIQISSNEMARLRRNDREAVRATVWEGTNVWHDVALHVKGAAGSRRGIDDKPALTLNFQKYVPDQRFHGLKKIHLNNSVQDGSYLCENICGELYRKAGIAAARVTYATVELNGRKRGFYVVKEGFTKDFLAMHFKDNDGNLYDGGFLREVTEQLERDIDGDNGPRDWSDLKALVKAAQVPEPFVRFQEMSKVLDVDRFATYCALQIMTWDWDGYLMNRNNYRVYHDPNTGKMVFLPHGMDQMFWETTHFPLPRPNHRFNGLIANRFIETPQGKKLYLERFGQVFSNVFQIEMLTNRVNELTELIRPYMSNTNDYNNQAKRIRDLIRSQHANFVRRLNEPEPKPPVFTSGIASITNWSITLRPADPANAIRDRVLHDGRQTLHVLTTNKTTNTAASWRANVLLHAGNYRFEAMAKAAGIVPVLNTNKGAGAGIRHSGISTNRLNKLIGDTGWEKLEYELRVKEEREVELIAELRAMAGEVWFDADSFKLVKIQPQAEVKVP
jgi:spore coat protein H